MQPQSTVHQPLLRILGMQKDGGGGGGGGD